MTTASAANSSVLSMPLNALLESAAVPSGPAMCTVSPAAPEAAMVRSESAAGDAALHQGTWVASQVYRLRLIGGGQAGRPEVDHDPWVHIRRDGL